MVELPWALRNQIRLESKLEGRQKVKGGNGSISASIARALLALSLPLNLGVGCAPSCWPIFGFRNLLGARRGHGGQFSVQSDNRFSGRGGGVGSLPRAWRRVGVPGGHRPGEGLVCVSVSAEGKFGFRCMHCTSDHEWADPNDHTDRKSVV